uniref:Uncharacterized protein n=1 Tax=Cannabis sativa TaxID=3483 RepID=A0A803QNK9_CANSA
MMNLPITITKDDAKNVYFQHNDPLVMEAQIANKRLSRFLVDNGGTMNILFKEAFKDTDPTVDPVCRKRRVLDPIRAKVVKAKVNKVTNIEFLWEALYPVWLANLVLFPKPNGT